MKRLRLERMAWRSRKASFQQCLDRLVNTIVKIQPYAHWHVVLTHVAKHLIPGSKNTFRGRLSWAGVTLECWMLFHAMDIVEAAPHNFKALEIIAPFPEMIRYKISYLASTHTDVPGHIKGRVDTLPESSAHNYVPTSINHTDRGVARTSVDPANARGTAAVEGRT